MAQASRIVRVSGLPTDIDEERLIDKLSVHFLRSSNGGGEIESVTINKKKPDCALVHFEDSGVAQRVIQHGQHTLKVDRKEYKLSVSEHRPTLDPDKVILSLTATVDYSQIPEGRSMLMRLQQDHPDVEMICDSAKKLGRLRGAYSKVQSALAQLLGHPEGSGQTSAKPLLESPIKNPKERGNGRDLHPPSSGEDLPLMVDADIFQYLRKRCGQEYQCIQSQHGVEVVDVTSEGLTTLFLRVTGEGGEEKQERIKNARKAIGALYQESERNICQAQLRKTDLNPRGSLKQAFEILGVRFPKLLLSDDDCNVFMVGDRGDVSEAKQFLLQEQNQANQEDVASLLKFPSYPPPATDVHLASPGIRGPLDERKAPQERRSKGSKSYHLAARLKDSAPTPLGDVRLPGSTTGLPAGHRSGAASGDSSGHPPMRSKTDSFVRKPSLSATPLTPSRPGSALKRAQSFSGALQQGDQKTEEDSSGCRPRTCSLSPQKDQQGLYHTEMLVSTVLWLHMKEAYSTQVEALTLDLQINEEASSGSVQSTISIRGAEPPAVAACELRLRELVDAVATDFCVHELCLSELGIVDPKDETLQACCAEVRQHFRKISVRVMKKSLYLLGSKRLCAQVGASLREVFSGGSTQTLEDKAGASPSTPASSSFTSACRQINQGHGRQTNTGTSTKARVSNHEEDRPETEPLNGSGGQMAARTDPDQDGPKTSTKGHLNDSQSEHLQEPDPARHAPVEGICVCGESGTSTTRTECGTVMCPKCLDAVHVHCRVCHSGAKTAPPRIQGKMNHCKLNFSLPGHNKHATIKITYLIPDGVQEKEHPSPGKPFQGDIFEAFLPDCEKSRKLLPRLEDAFRRGLTFTVTSEEKGSKVIWDAIPHKTSLQGGRSGNGYPDSSYLKRLSDVLTSLGIEEQADEF
ncbi:uncharacterized protein si:busm1-163l24.3 [Dunckerocampus dactyliophorus]|uniref:uncharacterized protein si:busm1-163l24.3 n=1 Tax=Dunckerocampus dactyliophorus TaxID=161453 RepID=UPI002405C823|nr:uncharacterized protein si:busm1-163l24.3 [Dunckerocampus dactyliophorus]XP_054614703.1 uncharacterized protein si:busm1-163l24.3 [Dunckerocampus dactyliophorus]XP_054614704.1 uncharacterized protein si:busm1-163l24.3 [Dunckerocampus dactyliophorus]XP_054614705.1 uncharacterized protein si:busm1-163l24.3 [Dunckerocampus dactyliophorus]XP_054614706.1 uncharacterized protein si:busm1-163l24.3 [Dunckerocampus dactyliophorus]